MTKKQRASGKPLISIITATYNAARFLPDTIRSIRAQSYANVEWIVIDGGSTDATLDLLKANQDIIAYWLSEPDRGIYNAWNKGLVQATGDWVCFLGADDYLWDAQALERIVPQLIKLPLEIRVAYAQVMLLNDQEQYLYPAGEPWSKIRKRFRQIMCIPHQGVMHRRSLFEFHGKFDESFRISGDYELLLRELLMAEAAFIPDMIITGMRLGGLSSTPQNSLVMLEEIRRAQQLRGLKLPSRIWVLAMARVYLRLFFWMMLGEHLARKLLDVGRRMMGKPPYWTKT